MAASVGAGLVDKNARGLCDILFQLARAKPKKRCDVGSSYDSPISSLRTTMTE